MSTHLKRLHLEINSKDIFQWGAFFQRTVISLLDILIYLIPVNQNVDLCTVKKFVELVSKCKTFKGEEMEIVVNPIDEKLKTRFIDFVNFSDAARPGYDTPDTTRGIIFHYITFEYEPRVGFHQADVAINYSNQNRSFSDGIMNNIAKFFPCDSFEKFAQYIQVLNEIEDCEVTKEFVAWQLFVDLCYRHDEYCPEYSIHLFECIEARERGNFIIEKHGKNNNTYFKKNALKEEFTIIV